MWIIRRDLLIDRQRFIYFPHRVQVSCHCQLRRAQKLMLGILRYEFFERFVRLGEFPFAPLCFREQDVCVGTRRCVRIAIDYLFVLLRGIGARQCGRCSRGPAIGIKPVAGKRDHCEEHDTQRGDDRFFETLPEHTRFKCDVARRRCGYWHKWSCTGSAKPDERGCYAMRRFLVQAMVRPLLKMPITESFKRANIRRSIGIFPTR